MYGPGHVQCKISGTKHHWRHLLFPLRCSHWDGSIKGVRTANRLDVERQKRSFLRDLPPYGPIQVSEYQYHAEYNRATKFSGPQCLAS